jgi:pyruvate/2-oxoglutarate dehydrogenase complex dihydrolipoamide dehydrogenase (E3) component
MSEAYDLVIIGCGSAGLSAAKIAVQLGARVALVDKQRIGGDCTWTGCVPSKTLIKAAKVAHTMRTAGRYGLPAVEPAVDLKTVMDQVRSVIGKIYDEESPEALRTEGIDTYLGGARFLDPHTLVAGEATLAAHNILIATGAHPYIPPIQGLADVDYSTYESIWDLDTLPRHLLVVGAGPTGCELAQAFRRLGSEVTLIAAGDQLLPRDEPDAAHVLDGVFASEGIRIVYNARAELAWRGQAEDSQIHVGAGSNGLAGDTLLIATGRRPNVDGLDLEKAGVDYDADGIRVDDNLRTSQRHIYAAGDCTGGYQFTHYAGWQAAMAVRNALLPGTAKGVSNRVPWTTFTEPEVAHVGLGEAQARQRYGDGFMTYRWPMDKVDRARTEGDPTGFVKLVYRKNGTLLGVTIVAAQAGEMIHEWIVALDQGIKVGDLSNALHVYPTYSIAAMQAAADIRVQQVLNGTSGWVLRGLARLMR